MGHKSRDQIRHHHSHVCVKFHTKLLISKEKRKVKKDMHVRNCEFFWVHASYIDIDANRYTLTVSTAGCKVAKNRSKIGSSQKLGQNMNKLPKPTPCLLDEKNDYVNVIVSLSDDRRNTSANHNKAALTHSVSITPHAARQVRVTRCGVMRIKHDKRVDTRMIAVRVDLGCIL